MTALGYDRLVTAAMIIIGAMIGVMGATVNPFSIGVAAGEAGVSIGEGIVLRVILWVLLTAMAMGWVLRYAAKVRSDQLAGRLRRARARGRIGHRSCGGGPCRQSRWSRPNPHGNPEMGTRDYRLRLRPHDLLGHPLVPHPRRYDWTGRL